MEQNRKKWVEIQEVAMYRISTEPELEKFYERYLFKRAGLGHSMASLIADRLGLENEVTALSIESAFYEMLASKPDIEDQSWEDLDAFVVRDPACSNQLDPFLHLKGFISLQAYRLANWLHSQGRLSLSMWLQWRLSTSFGIDIHPAAKIGKGIFIDHGTGIVIGETTCIGNGVSIYHGVTLGGTGKEAGLRHPIVEDNVTLYAGATALGRIRIGKNAVVAAGSLLLKDVPPDCTVMGIPARPRIVEAPCILESAIIEEVKK